jgi:hypothetical protein
VQERRLAAVDTLIVADGPLLATGDYDMRNGQAGLGLYWPHDRRTWSSPSIGRAGDRPYP